MINLQIQIENVEKASKEFINAMQVLMESYSEINKEDALEKSYTLMYIIKRSREKIRDYIEYKKDKIND